MTAPEPLLRLRGLTFAYEPGRPVLRGAGLDLRPGERLAITGSNGTGKSTLLHLIVGLLRPTQGSIEAFGRDCREESDFQAIRPRAGLVFQDPDDQLFCPTVLEDVAFGPLNQGLSKAEARQVAEETLVLLGLEGFAGRITHRLSGGEKRLAALAAVLAMRPQVLLLDEPTNALDRRTRERLIGLIRALPQAMLIVSHDAGFLEATATRTLEMVDGALVPVA